ncbi:enhanced intracellular survival protein Eis [Bacillus cereus group sp. BfR-BA-01380]|uniref:GNAT family N-acetyltransferase n=1 Tax=Bacillus cereus group sp. BfR-BA-01380 TaxID=2920324 RepID=UPI001F572946|nr:GNAT family N-acetyltransferase [Bacillus cereus group sp. BfR-BA-01380]
MEVIQLVEEQYREAIRLSEYAFQYKVAEDQIEKRLQLMKKYHQIFGILEEKELAAKLHLIPFEIFLGEEKFKMGGIAGVATYPEFRRNGYVKKLLKYVLETMRQDGYSVSMLHPFSVSFYRKYGWELFVNRLVCSLTKADLIMKEYVSGSIKRCKKDSHLKEIEIVYEQFAKKYSGMLVRERDIWLNFVYGDLNAAVYYNRADEPMGYILYKIESSKMKVEEFVPLNSEARTGLWNFICQHDSMIQELEMIVHEKEPLLFSLQEPRIKAEIKPYFMVRIVDVERFIKQYPFAWENNEEEVILHISDSFAHWNNQTVALRDKEAVMVSKEEAVALKGKGVQLNINALSTALFGYKSPWELYQIGVISGTENDIKQFENLIPSEQPFFYDFF